MGCVPWVWVRRDRGAIILFFIKSETFVRAEHAGPGSPGGMCPLGGRPLLGEGRLRPGLALSTRLAFVGQDCAGVKAEPGGRCCFVLSLL